MTSPSQCSRRQGMDAVSDLSPGKGKGRKEEGEGEGGREGHRGLPLDYVE